jgi:hypothetical protein
MLGTLLCAAIAAAMIMVTFFPETRIGRLLRQLLIEWPARKLPTLTRTHLVLVLLLAGAIVGLVKLGNTDATMVFGQTLSEGGAWFVALDAATYIDAMLVVWLIAALIPLRAVWRTVRAAGARARQWALRLAGRLAAARVSSGRSRSSHTRPPSGLQAKGDDDSRGPDYGFAPA